MTAIQDLNKRQITPISRFCKMDMRQRIVSISDNNRCDFPVMQPEPADTKH